MDGPQVGLCNLGAAVFASRRLDLWPETFGFHEVFHTFICAAQISAYIGNYSILSRVG
jgi:hemolysin III